MNKSILNRAFKNYSFDALISESPQTRRWFTGIATTDGWLIIEPSKATLFVDGRYFDYAKNNAKNVEVKLMSSQKELKSFFEKKSFKKVAVESDYLSLSSRSLIKKLTGVNTSDIISIKGQEIRIIKTKDEIDCLQKAVDISLEAFEKVKKYLKIGITEKEIDHKLNYIMKRLGADKEGFDNIIAFGKNTAEPHHHPTNTILKDGDIVTIDFGAMYNGYIADITRTFIFNAKNDKTNSQTDKKLLEILNVVEEAAKLGRNAVKSGVSAASIDKVCRDYIESKGYSKYFVHSTGHGIGLDVHEFPRVSKSDETILEEGMVITIEPGIYIEGIGGARIEDDVVVTEKGKKVLSRLEE